MSYRVHQFDLDMKRDQPRLERFLNSLEGEIVAVVPNVTPGPFNIPAVNFLLVIERVDESRPRKFDPGERIPEEIVVP